MGCCKEKKNIKGCACVFAGSLRGGVWPLSAVISVALRWVALTVELAWMLSHVLVRPLRLRGRTSLLSASITSSRTRTNTHTDTHTHTQCTHCADTPNHAQYSICFMYARRAISESFLWLHARGATSVWLCFTYTCTHTHTHTHIYTHTHTHFHGDLVTFPVCPILPLSVLSVSSPVPPRLEPLPPSGPDQNYCTGPARNPCASAPSTTGVHLPPPSQKQRHQPSRESSIFFRARRKTRPWERGDGACNCDWNNQGVCSPVARAHFKTFGIQR